MQSAKKFQDSFKNLWKFHKSIFNEYRRVPALCYLGTTWKASLLRKSYILFFPFEYIKYLLCSISLKTFAVLPDYLVQESHHSAGFEHAFLMRPLQDCRVGEGVWEEFEHSLLAILFGHLKENRNSAKHINNSFTNLWINSSNQIKLYL